MTKCPRCKAEINYLIKYEIYDADETIVFFDKDKKWKEEWVDGVNFFSEEYRCPHCNKLVARDEDRAKELLNKTITKKEDVLVASIDASGTISSVTPIRKEISL